ncbi:MAG: hypothetical protein OEZ06_28120 [Myxococcales bacterium]|nr:hypothetical protein [Myxococcales bacterium]
MDFKTRLSETFPGALEAADYLRLTTDALAPLGFTAENTIGCVGLCRDELCRPLADDVHDAWGEAFNFSSLGGMLLLGRTGFGAAHAHSPIFEGRERYVYYCMPHIGIGPGGEIGQCERPGREAPSKACGALAALCAEIDGGCLKFGRDPDDLEQSLLRERLLRVLEWGHTPDLLEVTHAARRAIQADLERAIELTVDTDRADYAAFTGIQIHGPGARTLVHAGPSWAAVGGERRAIEGLPMA